MYLYECMFKSLLQNTIIYSQVFTDTNINKNPNLPVFKANVVNQPMPFRLSVNNPFVYALSFDISFGHRLKKKNPNSFTKYHRLSVPNSQNIVMKWKIYLLHNSLSPAMCWGAPLSHFLISYSLQVCRSVTWTFSFLFFLFFDLAWIFIRSWRMPKTLWRKLTLFLFIYFFYLVIF